MHYPLKSSSDLAATLLFRVLTPIVRATVRAPRQPKTNLAIAITVVLFALSALLCVLSIFVLLRFE